MKPQISNKMLTDTFFSLHGNTWLMYRNSLHLSIGINLMMENIFKITSNAICGDIKHYESHSVELKFIFLILFQIIACLI